MGRVKLTAGRIGNLNCPVDIAQLFLWDTDAPGLAVRSTPGAKAFIYQSRLRSKSLRITIGDVRAWNIESARTEARRLQTLIDQGVDPRQEKAERIAVAQVNSQQAEQAATTVGVAWSEYLTARAKHWGERHKQDHIRAMLPGGQPITRGRRITENDTTAPGMLYRLADKKLAELDRKVVASWLQWANGRGKTEAAKHFRLLRAFVRWCADTDEYASITRADACDGRALRDQVKRSAAHDDCLQREQLKVWFEHVEQLRNHVHAAYLQALLLTGARREELAGLAWKDVDFKWESITIRDKVEGERTIPLTPYVASLLTSLPRRNNWVFSSPTAQSGRIQDPRIGHNKALAAAGLPHLTLHGLRRSFGTLSEWVECPIGVVAQIQGHKPSATAEKHYRVRALDLLRMWHKRIEAWILEQAGVEFELGKWGLRIASGS